MFGSNKKLQFSVSHQVVVRTELRVFSPKKEKVLFTYLVSLNTVLSNSGKCTSQSKSFNTWVMYKR